MNSKMTGFGSTVFANLVSLTLINLEPDTINISPSIISSEPPYNPLISLPASAFPSLRAVYSNCSDGGAGWHLLEPAHLPPQQLDMLQVARRCPPVTGSRLYPVLLTVDLTDFYSNTGALPLFEHFFLCTWSGRQDDADQGLLCLASFIDRSSLASLSLPAKLLPSSTLPNSLPPLSPAVATARDVLLRACEGSGVDVIWRRDCFEPEDDRGLSRDFWEYAKELRRKRAEGSA
jgi:hypothetical protein